MAGTKAGVLKAAAKNKSKYGKDFYSRIGKKKVERLVKLVDLLQTVDLQKGPEESVV